MIQVQLEEFLCTVDLETAENLKDPQYSGNYLKQLRALSAPKTPGPGLQTRQCILWKSSKCPTSEDHEATLSLLAARYELKETFADKKTHKNELWQQIANTLNVQGYFVGDGVEGREKVRQKFSNLQTSYIKFCDTRRRTGEGAVKPPKYYEEMERIMGDKHKVSPVLVIDSADPSTSTAVSPSPSTSATCSSEASTSTSGSGETPQRKFEHRFNKIKRSVRPQTAKRAALEELVQIQKENQVTRKDELKTLVALFTEESKQRHQQVMALITQLGKTGKEPKANKKRKLTKQSCGSSTDNDESE